MTGYLLELKAPAPAAPPKVVPLPTVPPVPPAERKPPAAPGSAATDSAAPVYGPGNNWGQTPVYHDLGGVRPPDFDPGKPATPDAPLGFLKDGRPWSPYGNSAGRGKIRKVPQPSMEGKDQNVPRGAPGAVQDRRLAPGDLKPAPELANLYRGLDDAHRREQEIVAEIRRQHPAATVGDPVHPKAIGAGELMRPDPHFGPSTVADLLSGTTGFLAKKLGDPDARPKQKTIDEAADKVSKASQFYGISTDPKAAATFAAVVALLGVFLPALLCALGKLIDKIRGK
jgi:hypothetical protein